MKARHDKLPGMWQELKSFHFWRAVRCEFLISLLYVFCGCGSLIKLDRSLDQMSNEIKVALVFGLASAVLTQCVAHISGAHMNPAVTITMLVTRNISVIRALFYVIAQCVGGIVGSAILYGLTPKHEHSLLGVTQIHPQLKLQQAFGVEFMITFIVVFTIFANLDRKRAESGSRSFAVGLSVILGTLFGLKFTGASMNPSRSLGPAIIMNEWKHHWVYWVGPILGGIIGGFTYEYTHDSSDQLQYLRRSFRQNKPAILQRTQSLTSTVSTEMTYTAGNDDLRI